MKPVGPRVIVSAIILAVAILVLMLPWYPVVQNWPVTQTFTNSYTYQYPTENYQSQQIYTLPYPVTLQGLFQSGATVNEVFKTETSLTLQSGSIVSLEVSQCTSCVTSVDEDFGSQVTVFSLSGSGSGDFTVTKSGSYSVHVANIGVSSSQVRSIVITANVPQNSMKVISDATYNTATVTQYSVTTRALSVVLGIIPSAIIIGLLGVILVLAIIVEFGLVERLGKVRKARRTRSRSTRAKASSNASKFCSNCGAALSSANKFCPQCGTKQG